MIILLSLAVFLTIMSWLWGGSTAKVVAESSPSPAPVPDADLLKPFPPSVFDEFAAVCVDCNPPDWTLAYQDASKDILIYTKPVHSHFPFPFPIDDEGKGKEARKIRPIGGVE